MDVIPLFLGLFLRGGIIEALFRNTSPKSFRDSILNLQNVDLEYTLEIFRTFTTSSDSPVKMQEVAQPEADCPHAKGIGLAEK